MPTENRRVKLFNGPQSISLIILPQSAPLVEARPHSGMIFES
jgi:hypothetical protein